MFKHKNELISHFNVKEGEMKLTSTILNIVALIILTIISLNMLVYGIFEYNFFAQVLGLGLDLSIWDRIVYILAGLSALWLVFSAFYNKGITFSKD